MASKNTSEKKQLSNSWLKALSVTGYKSIADKQTIEIRPLTILAGANSGGKSSIMQPLLLLKQTLDAPYDPGSLLLDGPNVRLTSAEQLLTKHSKSDSSRKFSIQFDMGPRRIEVCFHQLPRKGLEVFSTYFVDGKKEVLVTKDISEKDADSLIKEAKEYLPKDLIKNSKLNVVRERCFLTVELLINDGQIRFPLLNPGDTLTSRIAKLIHVPGLRGNPERNYKTTSVGDTFPGTFENYVASVIYHWQTVKDQRLTQLGSHLEQLGLTWKVKAEQRDETQVELKVGRLPHGSQGGAHDLVSIADVGFGVSQTLPALVALLAAKPGQLVYIEQPEIHLHPRAQRALASIFADAAKRGVIVILETHSSLILRGIQTLVAKDELDSNLVKLHWFKRDSLGGTNISSANLDSTGAFGDWPEDFDEVELTSDSEYLAAAEKKLFTAAEHE